MRLVRVTDTRIGVGKCLLFACCRQCGDVLTEEWAQCVDIHIADENHVEVGGIAEAFAIDLHDAVVVYRLQVLASEWFHARMIAVKNDASRVVVTHLRARLTVGQERLHAVQLAIERRRVCARTGEIEVGQLHQRLEVFRRRRAVDGLRLIAYGRAHTDNFRCQFFL